MEPRRIIVELRDRLGWSQTDLAENSGVSRVMIGKYERGEAQPSLEVAKKIADAFDVSLDYLVGEGINASFDKRTVKRLEIIEQLPEEEREQIYKVVDALIRDYRAKQAYTS